METHPDYRSAPGVNWSSLKHIAESPAHYQSYRTTPPKPPSAAMQLGTLIHLATLEPDRFASEVVVFDGDKRRKEWEEFKLEHAGRTIATRSEHDIAEECAAAVWRHPAARSVLSGCEFEKSLFWTDEATGLPCKGLADALRSDGGVLVDLKKTRSSESGAFGRQAASLMYHGQMGHYARGVEAIHGVTPRCYFVVVEPEPPYDVAVYEVDPGVPDGALAVGMRLRDGLMSKLAECVDRDEWPGRSETITPLSLPSWALDSESDDIFIGGEE